MTRRLIATDYGDPHRVLSVVDDEAPAPGPDEVVVRVQAAGLNPFDVKRVAGTMGADPAKLPLILGGEAAGTVVAGPGFVPGEPVVVYPATGAFAEQITARAESVHRLPDGVSAESAAGLLLAGVTAYDTVESLGVAAGDVVLVHGGSGAVGSIAVVLAAARGATVIATASPANHDHLRRLRAIPVDYSGDLVAAVRDAAPGPVTAVVDTVGTDAAVDASLAFVAADRIVSTAAWGRAADGVVLVDGSSADSRAHRRAAVAPLLAALADGEITVDIAGRYSLDDAADAFAALSGPHPRGKYLIVP